MRPVIPLAASAADRSVPRLPWEAARAPRVFQWSAHLLIATSLVAFWVVWADRLRPWWLGHPAQWSQAKAGLAGLWIGWVVLQGVTSILSGRAERLQRIARAADGEDLKWAAYRKEGRVGMSAGLMRAAYGSPGRVDVVERATGANEEVWYWGITEARGWEKRATMRDGQVIALQRDVLG